MTCGILFNDWLVKFDQKMRLNQRNVLVFIDNCTAHWDYINLKSIKTEFLSPNTINESRNNTKLKHTAKKLFEKLFTILMKADKTERN